MEYPIYYQGKKVGRMSVSICDIRVSFKAECEQEIQDVFRCYGKTKQDDPLLVGVLEPEKDGKLRLSREITMTQLHQEGAYPDLPTEYFLLGTLDQMKKEEQPITDKEDSTIGGLGITDPLILQAVRRGDIEWDGQRISCLFDPRSPNPMNFILTVCHLEKKEGMVYCIYDLKNLKKGG